MRKVTMSPMTLAFVVATRAAAAVGIGMLVARKIPRSRRRAVARTLIGIGALTTVPAALAVRRQNRRLAI
jgi:hypothetical protein